MKTIAMFVALLLPGVLHAADITMPPETIPVLSSHIDNGQIYCADRRIVRIKDIETYPKLFFTWFTVEHDLNINKHDVTFRARFYERLWKAMHGFLSDEPDITLRYIAEDGVSGWNVSREHAVDLAPVVARLEILGKEIRVERCVHEWKRGFIAQNQDIYQRFVDHYNQQVRLLQELDAQCKKPDIQGWTSDSRAVEYYECSQRTTDEHNRLVSVIKKLNGVYEVFKPGLESRGLAAQIQREDFFRDKKPAAE